MPKIQRGNFDPVFKGGRKDYGSAMAPGLAVAGAGRQIESTADQALRVARHHEAEDLREERAVKGLQIENGLRKSLMEEAEAWRDRRDVENFEKDAAESLSRIEAEHRQIAEGDPVMMRSYEKAYGMASSNFMKMIYNKRFQVRRENAAAEIDTLYEGALEDYSNIENEDPKVAETLRETELLKLDIKLDALVDSNLITPDQAGEVLKKLRNVGEIVRAEKRIAVDPNGALSALNKGEFNVTPDVEIKLIAKAEREILIQKNLNKKQEAELVKATEDEWFDKYAAGELTIEEIEAPGMDFIPPRTRLAWKGRVKQQIKDLNYEQTQIDKDNSAITYAGWSERVDLNPHDYTKSDIYNDVNPLHGGLTGFQAQQLSDRLMRNQLGTKADKAKTKSVKENVKAARRKIKAEYERGTFGDIDTAEGKIAAKGERANATIALEDWLLDNPDKDPAEWFDSYMELQAVELKAQALDTFWESVIPGGRNQANKMKKLASGEMDDSLARRYLIEVRGYNPGGVTDAHVEKVKSMKPFLEYKTRLIQTGLDDL